MKKYGLIGFPLGHSFSRNYFTEKFQREQIHGCVYENFPIEKIDDLHNLLSREKELCGLNVTIPYKEQVIPFLRYKNEIVESTGACNCIRIIDGKLSGFNTDAIGFEKTFSPHLKLYHKKALVLGTGGASKAVVYILQKLGIDPVYVSRSPGDRSNALSYAQLTAEIIGTHQVIINTSPVGMYPKGEEFPQIPYQFLTPDHYLYDLVYNPAKTIFLQKGEEYGAVIENGHDMLIIQAEESWKIWNE